MSQDERVTGKLRVIDITEDEAKAECKRLNIDFYDESWINTLCVESDRYCYLKGVGVCKIEEIITKDIYGCKININESIIEFDAIFYNGGAHWTEVVENAIKRYKN